jgi:hypothetical protein
LIEVGFKVSKIDEFLFYWKSCVFLLYTNDSILAGPKLKDVEKAIDRMQTAGLKLTVEGDISDFLGVKISRSKDGKAFEST